MTAIEFVLIDEDSYGFETFETEEELEEYLEDSGYDTEELEGIRVFEVSREYEVEADNNYTLKEV